MPFNPKKCEFLRITNKKSPLIHTYYIATSPIKEVTSTKYLGVLIDHKLTWNDHIQSIIHKAAQINGFLYRNLRQCPAHIKVCYKSMVRPILEYASSVWDPHTTANIQKLESVQRRAAAQRMDLSDVKPSTLSRILLALRCSLFFSLHCYHHVADNLRTSVIHAVHYSCHGSPYEPYLEDQ